jgi:hypothetical protein
MGIKRGTLVKHPKWGDAYVGGTMDGRISLHDPSTGKRLTQAAKVMEGRQIKLLRWRTWLVPLTPAASSPQKGIKRKEAGKEKRATARGNSSPA